MHSVQWKPAFASILAQERFTPSAQIPNSQRRIFPNSSPLISGNLLSIESSLVDLIVFTSVMIMVVVLFAIRIISLPTSSAWVKCSCYSAESFGSVRGRIWTKKVPFELIISTVSTYSKGFG